MQNYFYRDNAGKEIGPLDLDTLSKLRLAGVLNENTFVRSEDSSEWKPLREFLSPSTITQTPLKSSNKSTNWTWAALFVAGVIILAAWYFNNLPKQASENSSIERSGDHSQTAEQRHVVIFADNFNDNKIDFSKWETSGNTVTESNQAMQVLTTVMDGGGSLTSVPFAIANTGLITITRQVFLHHNDTVFFRGQNHFFDGRFGFKVGLIPLFSIQYADMDYAEGVNFRSCHGFFIARGDASVISLPDEIKVSAAISPLWDTWFDEKVTYDPVTGFVEYFINNAKQLTFNVGSLPQSSSPTMSLTFSAWAGIQDMSMFLMI